MISGIIDATKDENSFMYAGVEKNSLAISIKEYIEKNLDQSVNRSNSGNGNISGVLEKLLRLENQGVITDDEYTAAKKKLLVLKLFTSWCILISISIVFYLLSPVATLLPLSQCLCIFPGSMFR